MSASRNLHPKTRLVHAGTLRSRFGEVPEATFWPQGFVCDRAEQSEVRFNGTETATFFSRFSSPTVGPETKWRN